MLIKTQVAKDGYKAVGLGWVEKDWVQLGWVEIG